MSLTELLRWQRESYARNHASRANLLLHILVVPVFLIGNLALLEALVLGDWELAIAGLAAMTISVVLQGRGHKIEPLPPAPFASPLQAVQRIFLEQWATFPWYVWTGRWLQALREARD